MTCRNTRRMIWVFSGQLVLIACLVVFADHLPSWSIKVATTTAVLLPVAVYLAICREPAVCRAWRQAFREIWDFGWACAASLWRCLSVQSLVRVGRSVVTLRIFPNDSDAWVALPLFPFKLYVFMAAPFLWLARWIYGFFFPQFAYLRFPEATHAISQGYVLSLGILLIGALTQSLCSRRDRSTQTVLVLLLGAIFFCALHPWGTVGR